MPSVNAKENFSSVGDSALKPEQQIKTGCRDREVEYRRVLQNLQVAVYTTDNEGKITFYNQAAAALWGREPEIGKDLFCGSSKILRMDGSLIPFDVCPMAICLKERRPVYGDEILVARPDGSLRHVAPHPQPMFNDEGEMIGASNMLLDITATRHAEQAQRDSEAKFRELAESLEKNIEGQIFHLKRRNEALQSSEERYHKMVEEVEDYAIILLDKGGLIQNWNKGAEKIKGYLEEEIVGRSFSNFYLPEDRETGLPDKLLSQAREEGKAIHEGWRMRKDGSRFWGSIVLTALHDNQNSVIGFSKVTRDLTERKIAEDTMKEYTDQLEFQNKELEQFAYAASHDMKEPLRKIHLYNTYISENPLNILDEQSKVFLERSISAVNRMTDLIEDILTYSKTTTNYENFQKVDVNKIVDEVKQMYKEESEEVDIQFEVEQLPVIHAIPFQIKQLMFNLINNSIKYRHPGRKASIQVQTGLVKGSDINDLGADPYLTYQKISVIDNGIGFEPQFSEKIFKIFHRLTNTNHQSQGSGIGLAICKKIVQNHHGFIKATGQKNEGARFDVYFPKPYESLPLQ